MAISFSLAILPISLAQTGSTEKPKKLIAPPAPAASQALGPVVKEIEVEYVGPKSVSKSVILANMRTTVGQPYSAPAVEEDIRNLYATGFFVNLRISDEPLADGVKVIVIVQPKPLVKEIVIKGASRLPEKRVKKEVKSKPGDPLSEQQVATDAEKVKELYQNKGFNKVEVNYKIDVNEEFGRAVVTLNITENQRAFVTQVDFVGNKVLPTKELRKQLKTRKKDWLSWFNKSGLYKDDQFKDDLKKLRDHYQSKGYIDMAVKDIKFVYPEKDRMTVVITVFEGIQYTVGKVQIEGNQMYNTNVVRGRLKMLDAQVYSPQGLEKDVEAIKDLYGEKGYIDTYVTPERLANVENGKMDLVYKIKEGPQSFVEKIVIQGNNKTKDKVLRRELALAPGEVYDSVKAKASKARLENLGYFSKVEVNPQETAVPNRKNMVITVEEKRTGSITFGIGFSSVDSLLGFVELSQGNFDIANFPYFTGGGQKFRTRLQYGLRRKDFLLSVTEPWFLNQRLSLGFDLFYNENSYDSNEYSQRTMGGNVRLSKALDQFWTVGLKYQLENFDIYDVDNSASPVIKAEEGALSKSSITATLTYDTRDSVFLTRKGERIEFMAQAAGGPLWGQEDIYKFQVEAQKFVTLPYDVIVMLGGSTGVVNEYDDSSRVPIWDRYFAGGSRSIRGFNNRTVGPKDPTTGDPIGGKTFGYVNLELTFPIVDRVRGAVFTDAGFVDPDFADYSDVADIYSAGAGIGLRLNLPIGPLRLDLGMPYVNNSNNSDGIKFHFDVGYQF
jgi:outer membrane protein insertion porin family